MRVSGSVLGTRKSTISFEFDATASVAQVCASIYADTASISVKTAAIYGATSSIFAGTAANDTGGARVHAGKRSAFRVHRPEK
eukprot:1324922-Rhodomonas_salina.6